MKQNYIDGLEDKSLNEENLIEVKRILLTKNIIMVFIVSIIAIITILGFERLKIFIEIFSSSSSVFQIIGIALYGVTLSLLLIYYYASLFYILINRKKGNDWVYGLYYVRKKIDLITFISKCVSIFLFVLLFLFNPCTVVGQSMYPTFNDNDRLICTDIFYYPERNDVVIFNAEKYNDDVSFYIKRVVAKGNDKVSFIDGILYINDEIEERQGVTLLGFNNMLNSAIDNEATIGNDYFIVPDGLLVVLGDNRNNSTDSRRIGLIEEKEVYGKVILRLYPFNNLKWF